MHNKPWIIIIERLRYMNKLKFESINISQELKKAIADIGFEETTPIQSQAIPLLLEGYDIIGQSQTGTGKTAAFAIPVLDSIDLTKNEVQALILCPTRELAIQVAQEFKKLAKYKSQIKTLPIYGGQPIDRQIKALKKGVQIIIGTPGRVMDHIRRKTLSMQNVKFVVLDEADEMLDMGFREDIKFIVTRTSFHRQTTLFSATMSKEIKELSKLYLKNPKNVKVTPKELTVPNIEQFYFEVREKNKTETLCRLIDMYNPKVSLVFCNTKRRVDQLVDTLQTRGYLADSLHGDLKQHQRDRVMNKFRNHTIDILVATDVAARGIDVNNVEIVLNYDIPNDEEYYVHRIGRTGRAGKSGKAFSFVVGKDIYKIRDIQKYTKTKIKLKQVPSINDIKESKINNYLNIVKKTIDENNITKHLYLIERLTNEDYTSLEIAAALMKLMTESTEENDLYYEDLDVKQGSMARLFINIGRKNKVKPKDIIENIVNSTSLSGNLIGTIDIYDKFTFVEVPSKHAKEVLTIMKNSFIKGRKDRKSVV